MADTNYKARMQGIYEGRIVAAMTERFGYKNVMEVPRIEKIVACTPEQCVCGNCGKENSVIGYEKSEQLDVKPAEYFVVVTKREKRACKACEEQGVECAPAPARTHSG